MTPKQVAKAWHSVTDEWIVRRNKMHDTKQWEVVHNWGGDVIDDATMKVVGRFQTQEEAQRFARRLEDEARGQAVLDAFTNQ